MRLSKLRLGIITLSTLAVIGGGYGVYATIGNKTEPTSISSQLAAPAPNELTTTETTPTPAPEPLVQTPTQPAPQPEPTAPIVVRSFEEIVKDYPNMSTGAPGFPECAGYLKNAWPEKFQDNNREENIRWVSEKFYNVCAAIDLKTTRHEMYTLSRYWGQ